MDQKKGAGHHAITRDAVHELFTSGRATTGPDGVPRIEGLTEDEYFQQLDAAQEHQDRWYGPTTHPAWADPNAQREHAMADPSKSGQENLDIDRDYVGGQLEQARAAHADGADGTAMTHLGAAAHALEDSYSDAHMWRGDSVYSGDPHAPVESINVFDPTGLSPFSPGAPFTEGTHDPRFDEVPVDADGHVVRNSDKAAVQATAQMLETYEDNRDGSQADADAAFNQTVGADFQPASGGVVVNDSYLDSSWRAERDRRYQIQQSQSHPDAASDDAPGDSTGSPDAGVPGGVDTAGTNPSGDSSSGDGADACYDPSTGASSGDDGADACYDPSAGAGASYDSSADSSADYATADAG